MANLLRFLATSVVIAGVVSGCAPSLAPSASPAPPTPSAKANPTITPVTVAQAGEQPRRGGILKIAATTDPASLDIIQEVTYQTHTTLECAYSGLLQMDPLQNDKIIGDLAEKWEVGPDGLVQTFYLQKDVKWHDGTPFSAEDVKFSLDRMINPPKNIRSAPQPYLVSIKQVDVADPNTVRIILKQPSPSLLSFLALQQIVIYSKRFVEQKGDMTKDVMGTGPYKFKAYTVGISVEHVRNPDYFVKGRPYVDGLAFYLIKDAATRFAVFRARQVHLATEFAGPTVQQAEVIKTTLPDATVQSFPALVHKVLKPLTTKAPFNDVRVRQALSLSIDRPAAVKVLAGGEGWVGGPLPPYGSWALPEAELMSMPGYRKSKEEDLAEAKKLLAEAGYPNGFKTEILARVVPDEDFAVFLKAQFEKIGVNATLKIVDTAVRDRLARERAFDIYITTLGLKSLDPDDISRYYVKGNPQNYGDFYDEKVEELFQKQSQTMDPVERKRISLDVQRRLMETAGAIVAYWDTQRAAYLPELKNYKPGISIYNLNKYQDVWLAR